MAEEVKETMEQFETQLEESLNKAEQMKMQYGII